MPSPPDLEESYSARALPPGSARYLSHLFASAEARPALLGVYALSAEWQALLDPATGLEAGHIKLAWWQEEMLRLQNGGPRHPICRYLASLPGAEPGVFAPLGRAAAAAAAEASRVPIERRSDLKPHAAALIGMPLAVAASLAAPDSDGESIVASLEHLALGEYLSRALRDYRRDAARGRVPFAVDELLAAGIENAELAAALPSPALEAYLSSLREAAFAAYRDAEAVLPGPRRSSLRHLNVLNRLGIERLGRSRPSRLAPLKDMLIAWNAARHATR